MKLADLFEGREDFIIQQQADKVGCAVFRDRGQIPITANTHVDAGTKAINEFSKKLTEKGLDKYLQWMVNQYIENNFKGEDAYKVVEYLEKFRQYSPRWNYSKDIGVFTIRSLGATIEHIENADPEIQKSKRALEKEKVDAMKANGEIHVFAQDADMIIYIPNSEEAACYLGRGTRWCTAASKADNAFNQYDEQGHLYILMMKDGRKYQFHFETRQFMDEKDEPLTYEDGSDSIRSLTTKYPDLVKWFSVTAYDNLPKDWEDTDEDESEDVLCLLAFIDPKYLSRPEGKDFIDKISRWSISGDERWKKQG